MEVSKAIFTKEEIYMGAENSNKKQLIILILEILRAYSDEKHKLTMADIIRHMKRSYGITCDWRTIKNNILTLMDCGYDIECEDGYYLASREFEEAELRMLIDSILCSRTISEKESKLLIEKLKGLGNSYFEAKVSHICCNREMLHMDSKQLVYTVDAIHDAIDQKKKIAFTYNQYGTDFKLHPKRDLRYVVNPYQIVVNLGKYYLIGNYDKYDDVSHYRLDLMTEVEVLEERRKLKTKVKGMENGLNLPVHMIEHVYMYGGDSIHIKFKAVSGIMTELIDWLGNNFQILEDKEDYMIARVKCNEAAFFYWALQYGPGITVMEPARLKKRIYDEICAMKERYEEKNEQ